jgi:hypothetical protein
MTPKKNMSSSGMPRRAREVLAQVSRPWLRRRISIHLSSFVDLVGAGVGEAGGKQNVMLMYSTNRSHYGNGLESLHAALALHRYVPRLPYHTEVTCTA